MSARILSVDDGPDASIVDGDLFLIRLFENRASASPDAVAVRFEDRRLTYGELNVHANRLARYLAAEGCGSQDRIALWLEPGYERIVALLAILKLGAVACPLHLSLPAKLLVSVVENVAAKALLTSDAALEKAGLTTGAIRGCRIIRAAHSRVSIEEQAPHNLEPCSRWTDLAYIVHTSGSTGAPKAVAMSQKAFSYEIRWQRNQSGFNPPSTTLQFSSLGFDLFLTEIMSTLCHGGTVVVATEQVRNSSSSLLDAIQNYRIERLLISRVVLQGLAEEVLRRNEVPSSLKEIMCTGEQLTITAEIRQLFKRHWCLFYNEYGMSESPVVSAHIFRGSPDDWPDIPPAGKVAADGEVFILDESLKPVPNGEQGEVYVAGNFLADGYLGVDGEASAKFTANPFGPGLIFKSGDIGCLSPGHSIERDLMLLGRSDSVVNIRGIRIGLGEIEAALRGHALVKESAVIKVEDDKDARLIAYVSLRTPNEAFESMLREWLAEYLPPYAIPAHFVEMQEFPKTHSGKIDRRALPLPGTHRPKIATAYVEAETSLEMRILGIWKRVLKIDSIGVRDKVLELGGTSISMQQLICEINRELGISLAATDLFRFPSVDVLTKHISTAHLKLSDNAEEPEIADEDAEEHLHRRRRRRSRRGAEIEAQER